jgi:hypothetical protein
MTGGRGATPEIQTIRAADQHLQAEFGPPRCAVDLDEFAAWKRLLEFG